MTTFWLLAAGMLLVALAFVIPPLLRSRSTTDSDRDRLNAALIQEQLRELVADMRAGKLDEAYYSAAKTDLERELLEQLEATENTDSAPPRSGRWVTLLLAVFVPVVAVAVYWQLGTVDLEEKMALRAPTPAAGDGRHALAEAIGKLEQRMRETPDELQGWLLLARSYASLGRYQDAFNAYLQARRLAGDEPQLLVDAADMLVMANGGRFNQAVADLLDRALEQQPDNAKALWLKGHWLFRQGDAREAIDNWQKARSQLPADSENARVISQQINEAKRTLGDGAALETAQADTGEAETQKTAGAAIQVEVTLAPALASTISPDDTVFVFARAAAGPRMPLAIVRKRVADLPLTVTLDDSLAMTPAMVLSKFQEVEVGARVSRSGNAIPQSGDLQGSISPVSVSDSSKITVTIDERVP